MSNPSYCKTICDAIHGELDGKVILGNTRLIDFLIIAYFARGHVLIEGPPGTGKTLAAKVLARLLSKSFKRIQFTSDMLPQDILGAHIYSPDKRAFDFIKGPLFSDFVLADEINRTPPRTQSALLEAMEERQVSIEGTQHVLSQDFFVIATQNPQDHEGTFLLPEVELDRFMFNVVIDHAASSVEQEILKKILNGTLPPDFQRIRPLEIDRARIDAEVRNVRVDDSIVTYIARILDMTRTHPMVQTGSSVRGGITLGRGARILAMMRGREYVIPDDIKELAVVTLRHRLTLSPEAQISRISEKEVILEMLQKVEFPG